MRYDKEQIIVDFGLKPFGSQGWMTNKGMECPYCGKSGKWGIIFNDTGIATFHCWKCPRKVSLYEFLKKLGRTDLAKKTYTVKPDEIDKCPKLLWVQEEELVKEEDLKPVSLPLRLKPLVNDSYLNNRGFREEHYKQFEPSYTDTPLEPKLKNFIIFKMKVDGVCVAWWARSRYTKEWHKENLEAYKRHEADLVLRYRNSENNFQDLLGGCDEIVLGKTETVILVEGIFDAVNIQNLLGLTDKERSQVLSINLANHPNRKYKEVWIGLGGTQSAVYATEVSLEEYFTYTTEETEKMELFALSEKLGGNLELAIKRLAESKRNPEK